MTALIVAIFVIVALTSVTVAHQIGPHLNRDTRLAMWTKRLSMLLVLLSLSVSLLSKRLETPLWRLFVASLAVWFVSTAWYWLALRRDNHRSR